MTCILEHDGGAGVGACFDAGNVDPVAFGRRVAEEVEDCAGAGGQTHVCGCAAEGAHAAGAGTDGNKAIQVGFFAVVALGGGGGPLVGGRRGKRPLERRQRHFAPHRCGRGGCGRGGAVWREGKDGVFESEGRGRADTGAVKGVGDRAAAGVWEWVLGVVVRVDALCAREVVGGLVGGRVTAPAVWRGERRAGGRASAEACAVVEEAGRGRVVVAVGRKGDVCAVGLAVAGFGAVGKGGDDVGIGLHAEVQDGAMVLVVVEGEDGRGALARIEELGVEELRIYQPPIGNGCAHLVVHPDDAERLEIAKGRQQILHLGAECSGVSDEVDVHARVAVGQGARAGQHLGMSAWKRRATTHLAELGIAGNARSDGRAVKVVVRVLLHVGEGAGCMAAVVECEEDLCAVSWAYIQHTTHHAVFCQQPHKDALEQSTPLKRRPQCVARCIAGNTLHLRTSATPVQPHPTHMDELVADVRCVHRLWRLTSPRAYRRHSAAQHTRQVGRLGCGQPRQALGHKRRCLWLQLRVERRRWRVHIWIVHHRVRLGGWPVRRHREQRHGGGLCDNRASQKHLQIMLPSFFCHSPTCFPVLFVRAPYG